LDARSVDEWFLGGTDELVLGLIFFFQRFTRFVTLHKLA